MNKWCLSDEAKKQIEDEITELTLVHDYISKTNQENAEFSSIQDRDELILIDGGIKVPKVMMLENSNGITEIVNRVSKEFELEFVEDLAKRNGIEVNDVIALMQDEMQIEVLENGNIRQESLEKIAEVDEQGLMTFDEKWLEKLRPFEEVGLIKLSDSLVVKDMKPDSLQVVPLEKKKEELEKEDFEKQEIARVIGVEPDEILSVISIEDREGGSKLFNYDMTDVQKPLIARLRNNKFKVLKEDADGKKTEMIGFEATPVSKQVASLLKDTKNNLFTELQPGEVRAGKINPNQSEYNIFQIRRAGESRDDDLNNLLFVSTTGKTDMNVIESRERGEFRFARVPQSTIYPQNVYVENSNGVTKKKEITHTDNGSISFNDIERRKKLLEKLLEIDKTITEIEHESTEPTRRDSNDPDISDVLADGKRRLPDLYSRRDEILKSLGMEERDMIKITEEELGDDFRPGVRSRV